MVYAIQKVGGYIKDKMEEMTKLPFIIIGYTEFKTPQISLAIWIRNSRILAYLHFVSYYCEIYSRYILCCFRCFFHDNVGTCLVCFFHYHEDHNNDSVFALDLVVSRLWSFSHHFLIFIVFQSLTHLLRWFHRPRQHSISRTKIRHSTYPFSFLRSIYRFRYNRITPCGCVLK